MSAKIVDLSNYQAGFDFAAFKAGGGIAVICKASEGTSIADKSYRTFRPKALAAGLGFASYHFLRKGDMQAQAAYYLKCASPVQGERVVCDYEDASVPLTAAVDFLKAIRAADPSLQLTMYGSNVLEEALGTAKNDWLAANTSLWTAAYNNSGPGKYPTQVWPQWSLWQYSDNERVAGFYGAVDGNKFNGSDENCLKWFGPASAPEPQPEPGVGAFVSISVSGPVTITVNGVEVYSG
jgi:GH25 family lysozyme M1 (1,4-beta-N-acetylmuramidase)